MSWIDIFLSDGDPHRVYGADAQQALSHMMPLSQLPRLWMAYGRARVLLADRLCFIVLDLVRGIAYRRGFRAGASFPWPEDPT